MKALKPHSAMNTDHRAIVDLLERKGSEGASTTEVDNAGFRGYRARLSELRHDFDPPIDVVCHYEGTTNEGRRMHRYWLPQYAPHTARKRGPREFVVGPTSVSSKEVKVAQKPLAQIVGRPKLLCIACLGRFVTGMIFAGVCEKCGKKGRVTSS